jgi:ATP-dependent Zn protease
MEKHISLKDIYMELKKIERSMVTKAEMNEALETISVLSNEDTIKQVRESEEDVKYGRTKEIDSVEEL